MFQLSTGFAFVFVGSLCSTIAGVVDGGKVLREAPKQIACPLRTKAACKSQLAGECATQGGSRDMVVSVMLSATMINLQWHTKDIWTAFKEKDSIGVIIWLSSKSIK